MKKILKMHPIIRTGRQYSPKEVLTRFEPPTRRRGSAQKMFDGDEINMSSHRYWTFLERGLSCVSCGVEGAYFYKERFSGSDRYHFNLYAVDPEGDEVLMTKDHVVPKSKGGKNHIHNYQTMCKVCNERKGHNPDSSDRRPAVAVPVESIVFE